MRTPAIGCLNWAGEVSISKRPCRGGEPPRPIRGVLRPVRSSTRRSRHCLRRIRPLSPRSWGGVKRGDDRTPLLSEWATKAHLRRADKLLADWHLHHPHSPRERRIAVRPYGHRNGPSGCCPPPWVLGGTGPGAPNPASMARTDIQRFHRGMRPSRIVPDDELRALQQAGVNVILPDEKGLALIWVKGSLGPVIHGSDRQRKCAGASPTGIGGGYCR